MSYISRNRYFQPHIFLIFQEGTFRAQKIKNKTTLKNFLYLGKLNFLAPKKLNKTFVILLIKLPQEKLDASATFIIYWLLKHPVFESTTLSGTQSVRTPLVTLQLIVQYLRNLWEAMSRHWSPSTSDPNLALEGPGFPQRRQVS